MSTLTHPVVLMTLMSAFVWFGFDVIGPWLLRSTAAHIATQTECAASAPDPTPVMRAELAANAAEARAAAHAAESRTQLARILADIDRINGAYPPREQPGGMYTLVTDTSGTHLEPE